MAPEQIQLEGGELIGRDRDVRQRAKPGVDPVDRGAAGRVPVHDLARGADAW